MCFPMIIFGKFLVFCVDSGAMDLVATQNSREADVHAASPQEVGQMQMDLANFGRKRT